MDAKQKAIELLEDVVFIIDDADLIIYKDEFGSDDCGLIHDIRNFLRAMKQRKIDEFLEKKSKR